jgi:ribose 5-phosphate isomerase A
MRCYLVSGTGEEFLIGPSALSASDEGRSLRRGASAGRCAYGPRATQRQGRSSRRRCAGSAVIPSPPVPGSTSDVDADKRIAAEFAATLVEDGMRLGLGTGSTVAFLLPAIAGRHLSLRCVATSIGTEEQARSLGLDVESFHGIEALDRLDLAIDGADQVDDDGWIVKGGGAAHTREKRVAATADRFVVIVDPTKLVERVRAPIPLELMAFGLAATLRDLGRDLGDVELRDVPDSPDGGIIADFHGEIDDPRELASRFDATPGVVAHGLFPPEMTSEIVIGRSGEAETRPGGATTR